ncbi:MAG: NACHT domain-containing protein, partial [Candidatus Hodarchaeales archaeon]
MGKIVASLVASKMLERMGDRAVDGVQASDSFIGKVATKIIGEREIGKFKPAELKELLTEAFHESQLDRQIDGGQFNTIVEEAVKSTLVQLNYYEKSQDYSGFTSILTAQFSGMQAVLSADIREQFEQVKTEMLVEIGRIKTARETMLVKTLDDGKRLASESDLLQKSSVILVERKCANCKGFPLTDSKTSLTCPFCNAVYYKQETRDMDSIQELTYEKLQRLSALQLGHATMASYKDICYDPSLYVARESIQQAWEAFTDPSRMKERQKVFLLLGEAGLGKTWLASHLATSTLRKKGFPVFFISLREGLRGFFDLTFNGLSPETAMRKMVNAVTEVDKPLVVVMDGYDELPGDEERRLIAQLLKIVYKSNAPVFFLLSCRHYDWQLCPVVKRNRVELYNNVVWDRRGRSLDASRKGTAELQYYNEQEMKRALIHYKLPGAEKWPVGLRSLAMYPLWVRIIKERYGDELPQRLDISLFIDYFDRMDFGDVHLHAMGELAKVVLRNESCGKPEIKVKKISKRVSEIIQQHLASSGVVRKSYALLKSTVSFS